MQVSLRMTIWGGGGDTHNEGEKCDMGVVRHDS